MERKHTNGDATAKESEEPDPTAYGLAQFWDCGDDTLITCPYDISHKIRRFRMEKHLSVCRKQHPDAKVGICPYNASHVLPIRLFVAHVNGCPDMRLVDPDQDQDKGDWITKPHMFRSCIGGGVTMEEITKFWMDEKISPLIETSGENEGPAKALATRAPMLHDQYDLKRAMVMAVSSDRDRSGREYIERNIIAGGVPSLISCGGAYTEDPAVNTVQDHNPETLAPISRGPLACLPGANLSLEERVILRARSRVGSTRPLSSNSMVSAPF